MIYNQKIKDSYIKIILENNQEDEEFDLDWFLDHEAENLEQVQQKFDELKINYELIDLKGNKFILYGDEIIDDSANRDEKSDWIWKVWEDNLSDYVGSDDPEQEFTDEFWKYVGDNSVLYHGTSSERVESIKKHGLKCKDESRGISNRSTGAAVFTSQETEGTESYGDVMITIHLGPMKKDGYMPFVSMEGPIEEGNLRSALAHAIGLENFVDESYSSDGLSPDTIIVYGDIPAKYLTFEER